MRNPCEIFTSTPGGAVRRRSVEVIRTQPGITRGDKAFAVLPAAGFSHGRNRIGLGRQAVRDHLESHDLLLAGTVQREGNRSRFGVPAFRKVEPHRAFGARLGFGMHLRGEIERFGA